jgi:hypothetical protein
MKVLVAFAFAIAGACLLAPTAANAQATRTWVSGVGDDANPCSRTAPCKTFAGAISKTAAAGEINCLDSGGYGALTITKSIAIKCDGVEAGVLVSGTNGFVVSAASTDVVWISGLDFEGLGPTALSLNGIKIITAASVGVENCTIRGFGTNNGTDGNGIFLNNTGTTKLFVDNTVIADNQNVAVEVKPQAGAFATAEISNTRASDNGVGFRANGSLNSGGINVDVYHSVAYGNTGAGINATSGTGPAQIMVHDSTSSHNGTGLATGGSTGTIRVGYSTITGNNTSVSSGAGQPFGVNSYGNNQIDGNTTNTLPPTILLH